LFWLGQGVLRVVFGGVGGEQGSFFG